MGLLHLFLPGGSNILHVDINKPVFNEDTALVEEVLDHLKESGILGLGDVLQPLGDGQGASNRSAGVQIAVLN